MTLEVKMSKKVKLSLIISAILVVVLCGSVGVYVACGYKADDTAEAILEEENVAEMRGYVVVSPEISNGVGFIFYPGANVEYIAYLPLMDQLADRGFTCYLMKMPLNMAIMDTNRADRILKITVTSIASGLSVVTLWVELWHQNMLLKMQIKLTVLFFSALILTVTIPLIKLSQFTALLTLA